MIWLIPWKNLWINWIKYFELTPEAFYTPIFIGFWLITSISVLPWLMFNATTKSYGLYFIQYGQSLQSAQNIMNINQWCRAWQNQLDWRCGLSFHTWHRRSFHFSMTHLLLCLYRFSLGPCFTPWLKVMADISFNIGKKYIFVSYIFG